MAGPSGLEVPADNGTPRWVKVFGVLAIIVLVAFVILHLAGGGLRGH
jgi:hypothetical protein